DMAKLLKVPFLMFVPGCHFGHLVISTARESNLGKQLDKKLAKEKQLIRVLELYQKHKMFFKTDELARSLWNKPVPFVVEKLKDPDPAVRWVAVQIISRKRIPAEKELIELLSDPKAEVRDAAHKALVRLGRTIDFGLQPKLWTAWLGVQEPSTYRPGSSAEDFDLRLGEKKKKKE
ncbi:MAG TPA: HEAT repeat domain-containing protein, partial [Gemmataceae bacterium]|nr:HEAT repeat domain-containing protein [Gemmataceae bacterium]